MKHTDFYDTFKRIRQHIIDEIVAAVKAHGGEYSWEEIGECPIVAANPDTCEPEPLDVCIWSIKVDADDTISLKATGKEYGEDMTAAMRCWQYDKGGLQWYLPCLYELGTIIAYRDELNEVFKMLGADILDEDDWGWSSSEGYSWLAWFVLFGGGSFGTYFKCDSNVVRAVSAFSPLERGDFSSPSENGNGEYPVPPMTEEGAVEFLRSRGYSGTILKELSI